MVFTDFQEMRTNISNKPNIQKSCIKRLRIYIYGGNEKLIYNQFLGEGTLAVSKFYLAHHQYVRLLMAAAFQLTEDLQMERHRNMHWIKLKLAIS